MTDSILDSTKKLLGLDPDYDAFDADVIVHINSAISNLTQIKVGPELGFEVIDNAETWTQFLGKDPRLSSAKTYVYLKVRMVFDPPTTSYMLSAMEKLIAEAEWRLNVTTDTAPTAVILPEEL